MFELRQVGARTWYVECPARIGVYRTGERDVWLIDSGRDEDAARQFLQLATERDWKIRGIINTHAHADHTGGNRYLQEQSGCRIFARRAEAAAARYTMLNAAVVCGGYPCRDLRGKLLLARESETSELDGGAIPAELEVLPLPGHSMDMVGIRTPDGVAFLGDAVNSLKTLERYRVTYLYDVARQLETLAYLKTMKASLFIPAHAAPVEDIVPLAEANEAAIKEIRDWLLARLDEPAGFEELLDRLFGRYGLKVDYEQYTMVGSTLRAYLSWLRDSGLAEPCFRGNRMLWRLAGAGEGENGFLPPPSCKFRSGMV